MDIKSLFLEQPSTYIRKFQFQTIAITTIVALLLTTFFPANYGFVIILIVFLYFIANQWISMKQNNALDFNKDTHYKLMSIQKIIDQKINNEIKKKSVPQRLRNDIYKRYRLNSLYTDSDLIHFLYSVKNLSEYNENEFFSLVNGTNNILLLKKQIEDYYKANDYFPENMIESIEQAFELRTNCINNMHNFTYTIPKNNKMYDYHHKIIERYSILINRTLDQLYDYKQLHVIKTGITTNSKLHLLNLTKTTKPNDTMNTQFYY